MPGFSAFVTLIVATASWVIWQWPTRVRGTVAVAGLAAAIVGASTDLPLFLPLGLLVGSVSGGSLLSIPIPKTATPMLVVLLVLSAADVLWIALGDGVSDGLVDSMANFSIDFGNTTSSIGTADLILTALVTTHWLERRGAVALSILPGPLGMALANIYVQVTGADNLALVPFITLGWIASEAWNRAMAQRG